MYFSLSRILVQFNYSTILMLFVLSIIVMTDRTFRTKIVRRFLFSSLAIFLLTISDNVRFLSYQRATPSAARYISAATGYILRTIVLYIMGLIVNRNKNQHTFLFSLPHVITSFFSILSIPTGLVFSFTGDNIFIRGPLWFIPYLASLFYVLFMIAHSLRNYKVKLGESFVIILIIIFGLITTYLEAKKHYDLILSQTFAMGLLFYFIFLLTQNYRQDPLTNLLNRRCFYLDVKKYSKDNLVIVSMDLNNLKVINDTQGHSAGDKALIYCANAMDENLGHAARIYRIGGDEFMAIFRDVREERVKVMLELFQKSLRKSKYSVACGYKAFFPGNDIDEVISMSDAAMYENKKLFKSVQ